MAKLHKMLLNASAKQYTPKPNSLRLLTYSTPRVQTTFLAPKGPLPKNPILETLKKRKICFRCHEKWTPGHQYKNKTLNVMEGEETLVEASNEELVNDIDTGEEIMEEE